MARVQRRQIRITRRKSDVGSSKPKHFHAVGIANRHTDDSQGRTHAPTQGTLMNELTQTPALPFPQTCFHDLRGGWSATAWKLGDNSLDEWGGNDSSLACREISDRRCLTTPTLPRSAPLMIWGVAAKPTAQ